ncbi:MAG TPA: hypothetical protein VFS66_02670 [Acidimicrobiia bacterium]|nr:hypothetical protein [Acidimicrobiia bacterium]
MSQRARAVAVAVAILAVVGCGGPEETLDTTIPVGPGAVSAVAAVEELVDAINVPDFAEASRLAMPGQAALASLAEGADFASVAEALRDGDADIASNFWSGFAQGSADFLAGQVEVAAGSGIAEGNVTFETVDVVPASGGPRTVLLRDSDGYRVDLFASFGAGLAGKMSAPVERLLVTQTEDARLILEHLQGIVPSLLVAAKLPTTSDDVSQQLLALVEVITRVG